jgi:hypothetical protein
MLVLVVISFRVFTQLYMISCVLRLFVEDPWGSSVTIFVTKRRRYGDNTPIGDVTDGIKRDAIIGPASVAPPRSLLSPHGRGSVADSAEDGLATLS